MPPLDDRTYPAQIDESVSKTHIESQDFNDILDFAARLHQRYRLKDTRSHRTLAMLIGALGLAVRAARRDPESVNARCRKAGIKAVRLEVRVTRLIVGGRTAGQDQSARWANAAAYVAHPPNGNVPPPDWRAAVRYVERRGYRRLANLYAKRGRP